MKNLKISSANQEDIATWKNLQKYPGWKKVVAILEKEIPEFDSIINALGGDKELEYTKRDMAIIKKNAYQSLINLPETMVDLLSGTGERPTENMDAYEEELEESAIEEF